MMLKKPSQLDFSSKKIKMIISGYPGIGKTTLGLSASRPLLIDLDRGVDRVEARYRKDVILAEDYDELINDLTSNDLSNYDTIVIDTGGKLLDLLKPKVILENTKNGQKDGSLSLAGWGAVSRKFTEFMKMIETLNKHIVVIFHAKEERDGDSAKLRILVEGSTRDNVWQVMDLGGFIEMNGKNRTIGFSNCEKYYAKGTHGIRGTYTIPDLKEGQTNTFLTELFNKMIDDLQKEVIEQGKEQDIYDKAMLLVQLIQKATTEQNINDLIERIKSTEHALTSERELKLQLHEKSKQLNLVYAKNEGRYIANGNN